MLIGIVVGIARQVSTISLIVGERQRRQSRDGRPQSTFTQTIVATPKHNYALRTAVGLIVNQMKYVLHCMCIANACAFFSLYEYLRSLMLSIVKLHRMLIKQ